MSNVYSPSSLAALILISSFVFFSQNVHAHTRIREDFQKIWEDAWLKAGPFRINTLLLINNAGYDSNVYRTSGDSIQDYTFTFGLDFTLYLPLKKRLLLEIYESPRYVYYRETKMERAWNNYFHGKVHFFFGPFLFSLGNGYSDARERWNTEIDIRPRRKEDSYFASVLWKSPRKASFSFGFRRSTYNYENLYYEIFNLRDRLNREEQYINMAAYYDLSYRTKVLFGIEYGKFVFENPSSLRDSQSYGLYGGFEFSPMGRIRGRINIGYKYFDVLSQARKDYRGLVGDTTVSVRITQRLRIRALYKRDVRFSIWFNNAYYLENRYGGGVSVYIGRRIRLDYDYSLGKNDYPETLQAEPIIESTASEIIDIERQDDFEIHSVGLYFRLKQNIGIGLILSQWERNSSWYEGMYSQRFAGMNLTYDF